ncbi:LOW QUALITY PROTEIN: DNA-directed RNA polymerase I subunit RPA2 homolog [Dermatophagoides farinae]|uniref:LOW QUALITY PROTEIN: DNA-directed RNA polymerase I subunit RPA2 homolog n=1 Tax=Dermatophagoides farinae TaxID=6954 RepID=UPI003F61AAAF
MISSNLNNDTIKELEEQDSETIFESVKSIYLYYAIPIGLILGLAFGPLDQPTEIATQSMKDETRASQESIQASKEEILNDNKSILSDGSTNKANDKYLRKPTIGDKFASRAGQKGILSLQYNAEDMPYSETGIIPDIMFNPHGFPSRMTIGMILESSCGKLAALNGVYMDATPFRDYNECPIDEEFKTGHQSSSKIVHSIGQNLVKKGYEYYGTETFYSGHYGANSKCKIFVGVIYYQRLRHMINDKFQCRSTGPIDALTLQPLKGRKRGGGVRLGEMERDGLLSHGAVAVLQDRFITCSDGHEAWACYKCGSILSEKQTLADNSFTTKPYCNNEFVNYCLNAQAWIFVLTHRSEGLSKKTKNSLQPLLNLQKLEHIFDKLILRMLDKS